MPDVIGVDATEVIAKLQLVSNFSDKALVDAMQASQKVVVNHARSRHESRPKGVLGHPSKRYYNVFSHLTNSIRVDRKIIINQNEIRGSVLAGGTPMTTGGIVGYAASIELGTSKHPPYPFLNPALVESSQIIMAIFMGALKKMGL